MLMGGIRRSSHIMGFDKVKINTTPLLLLLLVGVVDVALSPAQTHRHLHTPSDRYHTSRRSHSHPDIYVARTPTHPHIPSSHSPLLLSRCLCPRHKHPSIPPPSLFSLLLQRLCLLQWTFMTTHSVRVLFSLPLSLFLLHSPQVKY